MSAFYSVKSKKWYTVKTCGYQVSECLTKFAIENLPPNILSRSCSRRIKINVRINYRFEKIRKMKITIVYLQDFCLLNEAVRTQFVGKTQPVYYCYRQYHRQYQNEEHTVWFRFSSITFYIETEGRQTFWNETVCTNIWRVIETITEINILDYCTEHFILEFRC